MKLYPQTWFPFRQAGFHGRPYTDTGNADEVPVHEVYLDAYNIGKFEVTNLEFMQTLQWAYDRGYLTDSSGEAYTGGRIYAAGQPVADIHGSNESSQIGFISDGAELGISNVFYILNQAGYGGQQFSMASHPVVCVSWYGAVCFCKWLSEMHGLEPCYDTPTWTRLEPLPNGYRLPTEAEWEPASWDGSGMALRNDQRCHRLHEGELLRYHLVKSAGNKQHDRHVARGLV